MKSKRAQILAFGLSFAVIFTFSTLALGHGWGQRGWMMGNDAAGMGPGYHMGYNGRGAWASSLTEEQAAEVQRLRDEFFQAADPLRRNIYEKRLAIADELAKQNPDRTRITRLQKEVSKLNGELDQLRLDFRLKVKKIVPDAVGPGYGHGFGHGMGPGYCWR